MELPSNIKPSKPNVLIVEGRFYTDIADKLAAGAIRVLEAAGATYERLEVPGAFEIPAAIALAATTEKYDAYIALGCVIRGDTSHYDYVCGESARGLQMLATGHGLAIGYGILTVENRVQADDRLGGNKGHKGEEVAECALRMIDIKNQFGVE